MTARVRFETAGRQGFATLAGEALAVLSAAPWAGGVPTGESLARDAVRLLAPVAPGKFIGLWNNFHEAAAKQGNTIPPEPLYFLKANSSIIGPEAAFRAPPDYAGKVIYEGELGVVLGRTCANVDEATAETAILGYTCVNDITAVDLMRTDPAFVQWARGKGCNGFGPVGPAIVSGLDWAAQRVQVALGGRVRQDYPLADMIIPPARIISLISREMRLDPGDVIACGTSVGALPMRPGMVVEVTIGGIGTLRNTYEAAV